MTGWIKLHRQMQENEMWYSQVFTYSQAWVDLLLDANHEQGSLYVRGNLVTVPPGFVGKSEDTLAKKWKWSRGKVRRFLKQLETVQQIVQHKSAVLSLIEIKNWKQYQVDDAENDTTDGTTERQQTVQQTDTNKNVKNVKNEKKLIGDGAPCAPTPAQQARRFFEEESHREEWIQRLVAKGVGEAFARGEVKKFCAYWTERNKSGTKQLWEIRETFELPRRLATWINRASSPKSS